MRFLPPPDLVGRGVDMAFGALLTCVVLGVVSHWPAFAGAIVLGLINWAVDMAMADAEDGG